MVHHAHEGDGAVEQGLAQAAADLKPHGIGQRATRLVEQHEREQHRDGDRPEDLAELVEDAAGREQDAAEGHAGTPPWVVLVHPKGEDARRGEGCRHHAQRHGGAADDIIGVPDEPQPCGDRSGRHPGHGEEPRAEALVTPGDGCEHRQRPREGAVATPCDPLP